MRNARIIIRHTFAFFDVVLHVGDAVEGVGCRPRGFCCCCRKSEGWDEGRVSLALCPADFTVLAKFDGGSVSGWATRAERTGIWFLGFGTGGVRQGNLVLGLATGGVCAFGIDED